MKCIIKYLIVIVLSFLATFYSNFNLNIIFTIPLLAFFMFNGINSFIFSLLGLFFGSFSFYKLNNDYTPSLYLLIALCIYFFLYHLLLIFNKKLIINYFISSTLSILFTYLIYMIPNDSFEIISFIFISLYTLIIIFIFSFLLKNYSFYLNTYNDNHSHILSYMLIILYLSNIKNIFDNLILFYVSLSLIIYTFIIYSLKYKSINCLALISSTLLLSLLFEINIIYENIFLILLITIALSINKTKSKILNSMLVLCCFIIYYFIINSNNLLYYFIISIFTSLLTLFISKRNEIFKENIYYNQYLINKKDINYQLENFENMFLSISSNFKKSYINRILSKTKEEVFDTLCKNCSKVEYCYKKDKHILLNYIKDCLNDTLTDDKINYIKNNCEKQEAYFTLLDKFTNSYVLNNYKKEDISKTKEIVAADFYSFSKVVNQCINSFNNDKLYLINNFYKNLKDELISYNYDVLFIKNMSSEKECKFDIAIKNIKRKDINLTLMPIINNLLNTHMVVSKIDTATLTFSYLIISIKEMKKIKIDYAIKQSNEDIKACGDSYEILESNKQFYIAISDGMGNGIEANEESKFTLDTMFSMLKTKMDVKTSIIITNDIIQLKNDYDCYSTLDLLAINKTSKIASFYKLGAVCSYIIRDHQVTQINNYSLPIGILDNVSPLPTSFVVKENDIIVICSDGMIDDDNKDALSILENVSTDDVKVIANVLFSQLINVRRNLDDATLVVVTIK